MTAARQRKALPALFQMEPIGLDSELEANGVIYRFCNKGGNDACRIKFLREHSNDNLERGVDPDAIEGTVCDQCGTELVSVAASNPQGALEVGQRVYWSDPDDNLCSGYGTITKINGEDDPDADEDTTAFLAMESGGEVEALLHELTRPASNPTAGDDRMDLISDVMGANNLSSEQWDGLSDQQQAQLIAEFQDGGDNPQGATARPWRVDYNASNTRILDTEGVTLAGVYDLRRDEDGSEEAANAALIVQAVNSYEGHVALLRGCVADLASYREDRTLEDDSYEALARAALALADSQGFECINCDAPVDREGQDCGQCSSETPSWKFPEGKEAQRQV